MDTMISVILCRNGILDINESFCGQKEKVVEAAEKRFTELAKSITSEKLDDSLISDALEDGYFENGNTIVFISWPENHKVV